MLEFITKFDIHFYALNVICTYIKQVCLNKVWSQATFVSNFFAQVLVIGRCEGRIVRTLIHCGVESIDVYDIGESGQAKVIIYFQNNGSIILVYFIKSII